MKGMIRSEYPCALADAIAQGEHIYTREDCDAAGCEHPEGDECTPGLASIDAQLRRKTRGNK